jgi:hypothetical protein
MECAIAGLFRAHGGLIEWFTASPSWTDLRLGRENSLWRLRHNTVCGDGLRPELQALFHRLVIDPHSELFVRSDGMMQSGPNPVPKKADVETPQLSTLCFPERSER